MNEQSQLGPSYDGTVVLDIGGDVGALMILTGPDLLLAEIEVSRPDGGDPVPPGQQSAGATPAHGADGHVHGPNGHEHTHEHAHTADGHGPRTHVAVRERRGPTGIRYAAIYPGLLAGDYTVWGLDGSAADTVCVVGGEVAKLDWR